MRKFISVIAIALLSFCMTGCDEAKEISASEFQAMLARNPESMRHTEFVGVKHGKAYLKVSTMSTLNPKKWTEEYFLTDAKKLPEEWLTKQKKSNEN